MSALLKTSTLSEEIGNLGASRVPARKPQQVLKLHAVRQVSVEPGWMKTVDAYWREHDFGRGGRPAPGTRLAVSISGYGVPVGVTCGKVLPYDGRWISSSFPILLMRPGYEPTSVSWVLSSAPARNGDTLLIATYDLIGCNLADGFDLSGTQVTGRFETETATLRARQLQLVDGENGGPTADQGRLDVGGAGPFVHSFSATGTRRAGQANASRDATAVEVGRGGLPVEPACNRKGVKS